MSDWSAERVEVLSAEHLRDTLHYDAQTGAFTWRVSRGRMRQGMRAGRLNNHGYIKITLERREYMAHRLAWLYTTGRWPNNEIDHRDGQRHNNRIANLREATDPQNQWNARRPKHNTSGFKGVTWGRRDRKWQAKITYFGKSIHIGYFDRPDVAHVAYMAKARELFGDFARSV